MTGRLSAVPPPADCTIAAFRFSVVSSAMPEYGGWPRTAARMFENIGLPVPDPLPDRDRLDAVTVAAMSAVEPFRLSLTCGLLLAPEYAGRLARRLTENTSLLAAALTDSGYAPEDVASLVTLTTPAALSDIGTRDRAAVQADCLAREPEWRRNFQFPPPEGLPEEVAQILAAP